MSSRIIPCNNCGSFNAAPLVKFKQDEAPGILDDRFQAVVCADCGLCFLNPQPTHEDYLRYYQSKGATISPGRRVITKEYILERKKHHRLYACWLDKNIDLPKTAKIIDMGCGYGSLLYFLRDLGYENVLGVEASEEGAEVARRVLKLNVLNGDAVARQFQPQSFDMAIGFAFVEHLTDPLTSLKVINGFLKPGGLLYLNTHDLKNLTARKGFKAFFKFVHPYYFTELTLTSILRQAGFKVVKSMCLPAITEYSNLIFPENCFHGELNIIARKTGSGDAESPLKEDYRGIIRGYRMIKLREWPYAVSSQMIFAGWGWPLRKIRRKFFSRFRRETRNARSNFLREANHVS